jgi:hemerythrin
LFKWRDEFRTNIRIIDEQHKKLFEIGGRLYDIAALSDSYDHYDEIMRILGELEDYTVYHFGFEENLLNEKGFINFDLHKIEHDFFIKKLKKIRNKDMEENQSESVMEIIKFVANWISEHILKSDFQYIGFLKEAGING